LSKTPPPSAPSLLPLDLWSRLDRASALLPTRWLGWLSAQERLTEKIARESGLSATMRLIEERVGFLTAEQQSLLSAPRDSGLLRRVELCSGDRVWVYAETLIPDHTLEAQPWLAELGSRPIPDALAWRSDVVSGGLEVAALPIAHPLAARALQRVSTAVDTIWARRACIAVSGSPFLIHEAFLPEPRRR